MNLQARKLELIGYLINLQDEKIISRIEATLKKIQKQENTLKQFTQKQLVERTKFANEDYKAWRFKTQEQIEIESETSY